MSMQDLLSGLAFGAVYALIALALVLIFRSTGILNFAQGEMATFTTFIAWTIIVGLGVPFWLGFIATLGIAGVVGAATFTLTIFPVRQASEFTVVMVTFGLFEVFNGLSSSIWKQNVRPFPTPFHGHPVKLLGAYLSPAQLGIFAVTIVVMGFLAILFRFTKLGYAMRAAAQNPVAAHLVGISTNRMYALGWLLSSVVGAIAGMLAGNVLFLSSSMMLNVLIFAFLAGILGGLTSPVGAVLGGLIVGVLSNAAGSLSFVGSELQLPLVLLLIIAVLLLRPTGLLGKAKQRRL